MGTGGQENTVENSQFCTTLKYGHNLSHKLNNQRNYCFSSIIRVTYFSHFDILGIWVFPKNSVKSNMPQFLCFLVVIIFVNNITVICGNIRMPKLT